MAGLEFLGLGLVKIEAHHLVIRIDSLKALLDERRPHKWDVGPSSSKLMAECGRTSASKGLVPVEVSVRLTPSSSSMEGHARATGAIAASLVKAKG